MAQFFSIKIYIFLLKLNSNTRVIILILLIEDILNSLVIKTFPTLIIFPSLKFYLISLYYC